MIDDLIKYRKMIDDLIKYWIEKLLENDVKLQKSNKIFGYDIRINPRWEWEPVYTIDFVFINKTTIHKKRKNIDDISIIDYSLTKEQIIFIDDLFDSKGLILDKSRNTIRITLYLDEYKHKLRQMKLERIIKRYGR